MDPNATWRMIVDGLQALAQSPDDPDLRDEAVEALRVLATWLARGGFPPALAVRPPQGA